MQEQNTVLAREIRDYVNHCGTLLRDIDYVLYDYELSSAAEPVTIRYAVDFSEIYNYVLPENTHETAPFPDGWVTGDPLQQFYVLSRFFSWTHIVLPDPYALELRSFFDNLVVRSIAYSLDEMDAAVEQLIEIYEAADGKNMLRIAADAAYRELSPQEIMGATHFYEKYGLVLGAAMRGMRFEPMHRLQQLLKRQPFISLEKITGSTPHVDQRRVEERLQIIMKRRRGNSAVASHNDAMAIEQVRAANRMLVPKKTVLRLVTRSPHMAAVVIADAHSHDWDGIDSFVRHPRIFSAAYSPAGGLTPEFIKLLKGRRDSIAVFIETVHNAPMDKLPHDGNLATPDIERAATIIKIRTMMDQIRSDWSRGENLAGSLSDEGEFEFIPTSAEAATRRLLAFLRQSQEIARSVRSRIRAVFRGARRGFGVLGVNLQHTTAEASGSILYPVEFESASLTATVAELASRWSTSATDTQRLYEESSDANGDYDLFLGLAISLGATGRWDAAKRYAALAITQADSDGISAHEAYFFGALCARKTLNPSQTYEAVESAIRLAVRSIAFAARLKNKNSRHARDARYLNEAAVASMWKLRFVKANDRAVHRERRRIEARLRRVLALTPPEKLVLQAYNSLTYLYLMPPRDATSAQQHLDALMKRLEVNYPSRADWPAFIVDTIVYANFRLRPDVDALTLGDWMRELRALSKHGDLAPREREWVLSHVAEIRDVLGTVDERALEEHSLEERA